MKIGDFIYGTLVSIGFFNITNWQNSGNDRKLLSLPLEGFPFSESDGPVAVASLVCQNSDRAFHRLLHVSAESHLHEYEYT